MNQIYDLWLSNDKLLRAIADFYSKIILNDTKSPRRSISFLVKSKIWSLCDFNLRIIVLRKVWFKIDFLIFSRFFWINFWNSRHSDFLYTKNIGKVIWAGRRQLRSIGRKLLFMASICRIDCSIIMRLFILLCRFLINGFWVGNLSAWPNLRRSKKRFTKVAKQPKKV